MSNELRETNGLAILTAEMKEVILASPFIALASVSKKGEPHLIVVGKVKQITDDSHLVFGVYKMEKTRENLAETGCLQVVVVSGKIGYRFTGKAVAQNEEVRFSIQEVAALL
ncbi:pyridoxamine 5'-phosphate oxidase family protein [Sporomusa sp.]|uniref:pyridoxamine 5'-phosphate oxidase family protein n=1 Tax=Sporomusa sp. TaxID=2078658 RepID=UPI002C7795C9|nr:pyridoxamine 5'-phosphate oxidase family protein [Sporomusa sp.]HWR44832.1 pyridoxamine 5'-phosphate oxidase family protein [Sporomusa sp.]